MQERTFNSFVRSQGWQKPETSNSAIQI